MCLYMEIHNLRDYIIVIIMFIIVIVIIVIANNNALLIYCKLSSANE